MKNKKTQGFFWFWGVCGFSFFLVAQWKTKKTWVFLVFHTSLTIILFKKPKKPWVFLVFQGQDQKKPKKPRQNQKKTNMSLRPNILWKVLFFWFFGFLEVLVILYFLRFNPNHKNSKYKVRQLRNYELSREQIEGIIGSMWLFPFWLSFNGK